MIVIDYEKLIVELQNVLPVKWDKVVLYSEYTSASYSFKYFVKIGDKYTDCFNLKGVSEDLLINEFMKLDTIIRPLRKKLSDKDKWTVMTVIFSNDGEFNADFDYTNESENDVDYFQKWKRKYLE